MQSHKGNTALHSVCCNKDETSSTSIVHVLLQAGTNPSLTNIDGRTPLVIIRLYKPSYHTAITFLEQVPDAEKASLLVKARRLAVATISDVIAPSCLQVRVARGQPLPGLLLRRVVLTSVTGSHKEVKEEGRTLRTMVEFLLGVGGPSGQGMPRDVFRVVMDLLMPSWDPLRRRVGAGVQVQG